MEILIVILIVVMIAQSVLFIYSNFIDLSNKRKEAALTEQLSMITAEFANEKRRFLEMIDMRDQHIEELRKAFENRGIQLQAALARLREHKDDDERGRNN